MKPHELMLKGYAMVGKQCVGGRFSHGNPYAPTAVCALGAIALGAFGYAGTFTSEAAKANGVFLDATGMTITEANDLGMSIEDIAGILKAEGA